MAASFVLFVTGPAGSGKTTVTTAWATRRASPAAAVDLDAVREVVKSGLDPGLGYSVEGDRQWRIARRSCAQLVRNLVEGGFDVALDAPSYPREPEAASFEWWRQALDGLPLIGPVVLHPDLDVVVERNAMRAKRLPEPLVRLIHDLYAQWRHEPRAVIIDNSALSADDVVVQLDRIVERARLGEP